MWKHERFAELVHQVQDLLDRWNDKLRGTPPTCGYDLFSASRQRRRPIGCCRGRKLRLDRNCARTRDAEPHAGDRREQGEQRFSGTP